MKLIALMVLEKETKGAVRYNEVDGSGAQMKGDHAILANIYIRKAALDGEAPKKLTVTLEG